MNRAQSLLLVIGMFLTFFIYACGTPEKNEEEITDRQVREGVILTGEQLSRKYCQSCHLYPEPSALDKNTWERSVLPLMGRLFGIYEENADRNRVLEGAINREMVIQKNIFPDKQLISDEEWQKINEYYISEAPESLPPIIRENTPVHLEGFETMIPPAGSELSMLTMVKIHPETSRIYVGRARGDHGELTILDQNFEIMESIPVPSPPVDIDIRENQLTLTLVGTLRLEPTDNSYGELIQIYRAPGEETYSNFSRFPNELNRPVQTIMEDINGNGYEDILIAEFGYYTGSLTLYEHDGPGSTWYTRKILKDAPGAVRVEVKDMNGNGHKDIVGLFAQGDESISIFYNDGEGGYHEEQVLRFNPSFGSVYFEIADLNSNGFPDIVYCNGDNGDYPPLLKDYHGIRIFENDGQNKFENVYHFPMYGVYKCAVEDFNANGLVDIVAVSFFPEEEADPRQDFIYLENIGSYEFIPKILKTNLSSRWLTFDIGDIDGNGYKDILLGAYGKYNHTSQSEPSHQENSLLLLKNPGIN